MIKTWQKWFVCVFAVLFISVFFVFDAFFINGDNTVVPPPIIAEDPEPDVPEPTPTPTDPTTPDEPDSPTIELPRYTNGYTCISDAFDRLSKVEHYVFKFASSGVSMGVAQNIQGTKYFSDNRFACEIYATCESSLGKTFYERITSPDYETFTRIKTSMNSNREYDLSKGDKNTYTRDELNDECYDRLKTYTMLPTKQNSMLASFDRLNNKNYYIAEFVYKVFPEVHINAIYKETGASKVDYKSLKVKYYVSKTTGYIDKVEQYETYSMTKGITLNVNYSMTGQLKVYSSKINMPF